MRSLVPLNMPCLVLTVVVPDHEESALVSTVIAGLRLLTQEYDNPTIAASKRRARRAFDRLFSDDIRVSVILPPPRRNPILH